MCNILEIVDVRCLQLRRMRRSNAVTSHIEIENMFTGILVLQALKSFIVSLPHP